MQPFSSIQLSATIKKGEREEYLLSAMARRAYSFDDEGRCTHLPNKDHFVLEVERYNESSEMMKTEFELFPFKPFSDVVVKGSAHNHSATLSFQASIAVGQHKPMVMQVHGKRMAYMDTTGNIRFTEPEKAEAVPLRFDNAYGGADTAMEAKMEPMDEEYVKRMPQINFDYSSGYRYPRNPCGKGYVIEKSKEAFEQLELPQLEHVQMPLTPANIILGHYENWIMQPLPMATDWVNAAWFPRIAYFGLVPHFNRKYIKGYFPEVAEQWVQPDFLQSDESTDWLDMRAANGAHPALQLPFLNGTEHVLLTNIHPHQAQFTLKLPAHAPRMWVDGRKGKMIATQAVISTLLIDMDLKEVVIIWRGSAPALRPYFDHELDTMPYKVEW